MYRIVSKIINNRPYIQMINLLFLSEISILTQNIGYMRDQKKVFSLKIKILALSPMNNNNNSSI